MSRIHTRRIFPGGPAAPNRCWRRERNEASCPAKRAQRDSEQSSRSDHGSGSGAGLGVVRCLLLCLLPGPRLRLGNAAPSHLLVPAPLTPSCCSGEAALWSLSCSAVPLLRGLLPRVAAQLLIRRNKLDGLECSCSRSLRAERRRRAARGRSSRSIWREARQSAASGSAAAPLLRPRRRLPPGVLLLSSPPAPSLSATLLSSGAGFSRQLRESGGEAAG